MALPTYEALMRPALEVLERSGPTAFRVLVELVADEVALSETDRAATIDSGQTVINNRVGWAVTYLVQAGAIRRPRRGVAEITDRGRDLLSRVDGSISKEDLLEFPEFQEFRRRSRSSRRGPAGREVPPPDEDATEDDSVSPQEVISNTVATVHAALVGDVIDRIMELTPVGFEQLVLQLLGAMGYGASGQIESTAESGDAGIDGVISQDPLGLDRIYVQAKRYSRDRSIGRPAMQAFVGALQGQQADRGVFMSTCRFTQDALTYADRVGVRIVPVDGDALADLMLKHRLGVQPRYTATLLRLDEDFFENL